MPKKLKGTRVFPPGCFLMILPISLNKNSLTSLASFFLSHHNFDAEFPWFDNTIGNMDPRSEHMLLIDEGPVGTFVPDIRKINILNRRMIVSCKRTHNLFDLTNLWKNNVIDNMVDDLPSNQFHHKPLGPMDEKLEDLLNQEPSITCLIPGHSPPSRK